VLPASRPTIIIMTYVNLARDYSGDFDGVSQPRLGGEAPRRAPSQRASGDDFHSAGTPPPLLPLRHVFYRATPHCE